MYKAKTKTMELTLCGMFSAVVAIGTMAISIPVPMTSGFINVGDGIILSIAFLFGGHYALIAGGLGSALADILLGYAHWAPFTLIIKGLMGYAAVKMFDSAKSPLNFRNMFTVLVAEFIMVFGYFLGGGLLKSSFLVSLQSVPSNCVQGAGAFFVFIVLATGLGKVMKRGN